MTDANDIRTVMDRISDRLARHGETLTTEDAIKTVLVSPLLAALGHDPSDPDLVMVGVKTSDGRADYSVLDADRNPAMLVAICSDPDNADSARARSLATLADTGARVGMLTDGRRHRLHLLSRDGLDRHPFLSFDIGDGTDPSVLLPLSRDSFDVDAAIAAARTTRPADIAWDFLLAQAEQEGAVHSEIVDNLVAQGVSGDRAEAGARDALRRLGRVMRGEEPAVEVVAEDGDGDDDRRPLTGDEIAAMDIVREIVGRYVNPDLVVARQAKTYLALNYTDNNRRTICRLYLLSQSARYVGTFVGRDETRRRIQTYADVANHEQALLDRLREMDPGAFREQSASLATSETAMGSDDAPATPEADAETRPSAGIETIPQDGFEIAPDGVAAGEGDDIIAEATTGDDALEPAAPAEAAETTGIEERRGDDDRQEP